MDGSPAVLEGEFKVVQPSADTIQDTVTNSHDHREAELRDIQPPAPEPQTDSETRDEIPDGSTAREVMAHRPIILPEGCSKADAVYILSKNIPNNAFGLPVHILRSDMFPYPLDGMKQGDIDAAVTKLVYDEGFPTFENSSLFWNQMPHEPYDDFYLFQAFLDMAETTGIRQVAMLATEQRVPLDRVTSLYREYYWGARAKAHDLFIAAADKKRREFRIRNAENKHFVQADGLLSVLANRFVDPKWIDELSASEAIDVLEKLIKIQRLSLGLTGQHASSLAAPTSTGETVEVIMRKLAANGGDVKDVSNMSSDISVLLADPKMGMMAQELIIRATRGGTPVITNQEAGFDA